MLITPVHPKLYVLSVIVLEVLSRQSMLYVIEPSFYKYILIGFFSQGPQ